MKEFLKQFVLFKLLVAIIKNHLNIWATIKINYALFEGITARKLPIFIFGKQKITLVNAKGIIDSPVETGMIRIGVNFDKLFADNGGGVIVIKNGELIFRGASVFSTKVSLIINGGRLEVGDCSVVGCGTHIQSRKILIIGIGCRISQFVILLDTNIHYMRDVETGKILPRDSVTKIGDYCWIGMRSRIMKGSVLPEYSVVAAGTLINKDMTKDCPLYPTFAGTPAKLVGSGRVRVFDLRHESVINDFFASNPDASYFQDQIGFIDEIEGNAIQFGYQRNK